MTRKRKLKCLVYYFPFILVAYCIFLFRYQRSWRNADREGDGGPEKIDWHNAEFVRTESERLGTGERGAPAQIPPDHDYSKCDVGKVYKDIGYNGCLSDYVSINRSVPDYRHASCRRKKYLRRLPKVSIIIPIFNEHWTILLRAIHSIINRAPAELIEEMILIDDGSTDAQMKQPLDNYVASNLPKARIFHLPAPRKGLVGARLFGARKATAEVLLFLDSNIEANTNWLPPLLEPIAENNKTCVCPIIDIIDTNTLAHLDTIGDGPRNAFSWFLTQDRNPPLPEDRTDPTKPFKTPAMIGCAFAISRKFFWHLGGFDPGLQVWGSEQYELAFKVWMCGGTLVDAPCSRIAHLYRATYQPFANPGVGDYLGRNIKRVIDVWMDEYAQYVYVRLPDLRRTNPGDLSKQRELRKRLRCKPFKWYMEEIAYDILWKRPLVDPPEYGSGKIRSALNRRSCLTSGTSKEFLTLQACTLGSSALFEQEFLLTHRKFIEIGETCHCLHVRDKISKARVYKSRCEDMWMGHGNQLWRYDLKTQQFKFDRRGELCLDCNPETSSVFLDVCDTTSQSQKWRVDYVNVDALAKWNETAPFVRDSFFS